MKMSDEGNEEMKEGKKYAVFVCIDYVGSTKLIETLGEKEAGRRINFYRDTVDRIFENFKGIGKGWSGEGNFFFFFYSEENKAIEDNAVQAAIRCIADLRTGIDVEISARISIGSGIIEAGKDLGKITSHEISLTGHINSACPENSILITENVYFGLSEELRHKFKICGTTKRDNVLTFIYPVEKKDKVKREEFLDERDDWSKDYFNYIKFIESSNTTLLVTGIRQIEKIPTLDLEEGFFPIRLTKAEKRIFTPELLERELEKEKTIKNIRETAVSRNFLDVLKTDKHIVILGDPGAGKTTILKYIALMYSRGLKKIYEKFGFEECLLPILVPVSAIYTLMENGNKYILDAICDYFKTQGIENMEKFIKENLDKGKCIILLDGIDEVPTYQGRFSIVKNIEKFIKRYGNNRFIITSRIIGYERINIDSITEYYVSQLDDNEIKKFVDNWFMAFEKKINKSMPESAIKKIVDSNTTQLINSINEDKNIKDLARNPFLLSLICLVQKSGFKLPRYRVELYRIITETLFETWVMARNIGGKSLVEAKDYKEGEKVLAPMALWMHENCPGGIGKEEKLKEKLIEIMKERGIAENEARNTTIEFFKYLAEQTQIIIPKGGDYYGFRHLSFEEFLAARALIMKEKYDKYLEKYSKDPRWTEVFLLTAGWLGIVDGREEEVTRIVESLMKSEKLGDLILAGKIVAENLGVKKDVGKKVINMIRNKWLYKSFEFMDVVDVRAEIIEKIFEKTLLRDEGKETYEKFIEILKNKGENELMRERAANGLCSLLREDANIKEIFIEVLKNKGENKFVRRRAALYLSSLIKEDANIKEIFIEVLKNKEEYEGVRKRATDDLYSLLREDANIKEIFIEVLKNKGENKFVRGRAAFYLSSLIKEDANIKEIFIEILKDKYESKKLKETIRKHI
ncbi:MAG: hypothetical protein CVT88_01350 [Candidatus Altiarchaeales archaeon HGW-Altiarchaeales-1]|nr:MAG: hypothetical protein CVT88_01350 [Candidatus Altiarchaeales archaeon HGW-Altiarchaeales-1]